MAISVRVTATVAGLETGPFEIRETNSSGTVVATGVTRTQLLTGFDVSVSNGTTQVYVGVTSGACTGTNKTATISLAPQPVPVPSPTGPTPVPQPTAPTPNPQPVPQPTAPVAPQPVPAPTVTPQPVPQPVAPVPVPAAPVPVPAAPVPAPTAPVPAPIASPLGTRLVRCDNNTNNWYTPQTNISSGWIFYSGGLVCYRSLGNVYDLTGLTNIGGGTPYPPGDPNIPSACNIC